MSNSWSIRAARVPRPPVCISRDPYRTWPLLVELVLNWTAFAHSQSSSFGGTAIATRVPKTQGYTTAGIDQQGHPFTASAIIPRAEFLGGPTAATIVIFVFLSGGNVLTLSGSTNPWPGTLPFTSTTAPLAGNAGFVSGNWAYKFSGVA